MKLMRLAALPMLLAMALLAACRNDPVGVDAQPKICFSTQVLPVYQTNCAKSGCHGGSEGRSEGGMNLSTAAGILKNVTPGKPFDSRIYTALTNTWEGVMPPPPNQPLTLEQRTAVYLWILQGADTTCVTR
jgi:hypothetical protein